MTPGRRVSALVWGAGSPSLVLLHGGGQNAHTWDTVALALDRPLLAVDLPGHGHSDWPEDARALDPSAMADDVAAVVSRLAPDAAAVIGMSLGGVTAIALATRHPELVRRLLLVDITPGVNREKSSDIAAFLAGPESFTSFDEILQRTIEFNPTRSVSSLRRGVLHNAVQREDGSWTWRHQLGRPAQSSALHVDQVDFAAQWDDLEHVAAPVLLARGSLSPVVDDDDVAEFRRRRPARHAWWWSTTRGTASRATVPWSWPASSPGSSPRPRPEPESGAKPGRAAGGSGGSPAGVGLAMGERLRRLFGEGDGQHLADLRSRVEAELLPDRLGHVLQVGLVAGGQDHRASGRPGGRPAPSGARRRWAAPGPAGSPPRSCPPPRTPACPAAG